MNPSCHPTLIFKNTTQPNLWRNSINDQGVIGSVVREIDVVPGIYNVVMAKVTLPDHPNAKVSLGVYDELAANVNFSTLSVEPMAHAVAEDFEETILYFSFRPNTDKMSLVMMYQSAEFGRVILDDVKVISIEPFERDTLLSMTFDDTSGVYNDWRSSIWPDSLIFNDSILLSYISHDTLQGRMRLDMVEDVNNEEEGIIFGAATRKMTGLEVGRPYEISFEIQTDGTSQLKQANVGVFPNSMFSMGIVWDSQDSEELDSIEVMNADSITLRFTATESDMVISISANARIAAPYHYYIDNFQLREGFVKTLNCDRSNLLLADQESRYRFGFNGQERETEINPSVTSAEYWMYDGRLGRRWNVDPVDQISISNYAAFTNNPIIKIDPRGDDDYFFESVKNKNGKTVLVLSTMEITEEGSANRFFVRDPNATAETSNRFHNYEMIMIPTIWYNESDFRGKEGVFKLDQSQYDIDRNEWLNGSGAEYSDKNWFQRFMDDLADSDVAIQLVEITASRLKLGKIGKLLGIKKGPKNLLEEVKSGQQKELEKAIKTQKRLKQSQSGKNKVGRSNQDIKGSHHSGKRGGDTHSTGNSRRAKDQGVKGPDLTK